MSDKETYGQVLNRQLMAIDFLSYELSNEIREKKLLPYITSLGISFFTLHSRETIEGKAALKTDDDFLLNGNPRPMQTIKLENGKPTCEIGKALQVIHCLGLKIELHIPRKG